MTIVMLTPFPPMVDGVGTYAASIVSDLADEFEFHILTPSDRDHTRGLGPSLGPLKGVSVSPGWNTADPFYPLRLVRRIMDLDPDVVHIQHVHLSYGRPAGLPLIMGLLILRIVRCPVVVTLHNIGSLEGFRAYRLYERERISGKAFAVSIRAVCALSTVIHVMKESDARLLVNEFNVARSKIAVVPFRSRLINRIYSNAAKERLGYGEAFVLGCFGFADPGKGFGNAIRALSILREKLDDVFLAFFGMFSQYQDSVYRQICESEYHKLVDLARQLGLEDSVRFFIDVDEGRLSEILSVVDVFLFPYLAGAGISASLYSVAGLGTPVIVTDTGKFDFIIDGHTGLKVPADTSEAIANATLLLYRRPQLGRKLGNQLRATLARVSPAEVASKMKAIYEEVGAHKPAFPGGPDSG